MKAALCAFLTACCAAGVAAQYAVPHVTASPEPVSTSLGATTIVNHGLVGVGRLPASLRDPFGDTMGSVSGLQITNWTRTPDGRYAGTFNILPDRGYNAGTFYSDFATRILQVPFVFAPGEDVDHDGPTSIEEVHTGRQVVFHLPPRGVHVRYDDPVTHARSVTSGLDPGASVGTLFGKPVPYVTTYAGPRYPGATDVTTISGVNKLAVDAEALVLRSDGSGYIGDEYGPYVYHFDSTKTITGAIVPPPAFLPHKPAGVLNFSSAASPVDGRRNNQGMEGVALSPDGSRLFVMLQSATVQDGNPAANDALARHTRLLVYDVHDTPAPEAPAAEYVLSLPTWTSDGRGGEPDRTAAQSEIIALDNARLLVLARDSNGLGTIVGGPSVFKSVLLVDTSIGGATNFAGDAARNREGGRVTTSPGVLDPAIVPLAWVETVNLLDRTRLGRFGVVLDRGVSDGASPAPAVSRLTLGEKWEGMALVPAHDPARPNDWFLFVANDNDFLTSDGHMPGPGGTSVPYDGFAGYPPNRIPPAADGAAHENDTVFLVYRVTIVTKR